MPSDAPFHAIISDKGSLIANGASARVFAWQGDQVLKLYHEAVSDEMIDREWDIATLAVELGLPVAAATGRWRGEGDRALLFRRVTGDTMMAALRRRPWRTGQLLAIMGEVQVAIHRHPVTGLRPLIDVLRTDICYGPAPKALQDAACAYLDRLPSGDRLLHGDLHVGNILLSDAGPVVIDWAKGAMGQPAADLVRTEMLMRFGQGASDPLTNIWRDRSAAELVSHYRRAGDVPIVDLDAWRPVVALAWLRARSPVRTRAFCRYLNRALEKVSLPTLAA